MQDTQRVSVVDKCFAYWYITLSQNSSMVLETKEIGL